MRKLLASALVACALTTPATARPAFRFVLMTDQDGPRDGCTLVVLDGSPFTGGQNTFTGLLLLAAPSLGPADAWCEVKIDGVQELRLDPLVPGLPLAVNVRQATFSATATQDVQVCSHNTSVVTSGCSGVTTTQVPPEAVYTALAPVFLQLDATICPTLASLAPGLPPTLDVNSEGDVSIPGGRVWDCPPYTS